jgi:hypothetical protein
MMMTHVTARAELMGEPKSWCLLTPMAQPQFIFVSKRLEGWTSWTVYFVPRLDGILYEQVRLIRERPLCLI